VTETQLPATYAVIDKIERTPLAQSQQKLTDAGLDAASGGDITSLVTKRDRWTAAGRVPRRCRGERAVMRFEQYFATLEQLGVRDYVDLDLRIVRGLAYYTGIVFELFDATGEFRRSAVAGRTTICCRR
jgi:histidyl-tRNA synthetase